jgi:hypothetical protein
MREKRKVPTGHLFSAFFQREREGEGRIEERVGQTEVAEGGE